MSKGHHVIQQLVCDTRIAMGQQKWPTSPAPHAETTGRWPMPNRSSSTSAARIEWIVQQLPVWIISFIPEALIHIDPIPVPWSIGISIHILRDLLAVHMPKRRKSSRRHPESLSALSGGGWGGGSDPE